MPVFDYSGFNVAGKQVKGNVDAESERAARQKLRLQNIYASSLSASIKKPGSVKSVAAGRDIAAFFKRERTSLSELAIATRQLATLTGAGIPLVASLQALSEQIEAGPLQRIIIDSKEKVEEGSSLSKALGNFPRSFPRLYVNMVASGEASGTLDTVLENLADYLEAQQELWRKVSSALFYPVLMLVFCVLVVIGLLTYVVPNIVDIFIKQGAVLPLPTRIMLGISKFLTSFWYLLAVLIVAGIIGARWYYASPTGRSKIDRILLNLPIIGTLYVRISTARVSKTLSTLLQSGVQLLPALDIVSNIVGNIHLREALISARDGVREGKSLARELEKAKVFPTMLINMISIGETSGKLEPMLTRAGRSFENEVNAKIAGLTTLIEPVMMIILGGIVLSIVVSILLPMTDLIEIMRK